MSGINKVILVGNLGRDPEVKFTSAGAPIANLAIATSDSWTDKKTGEKKEKTEWHRVVIFGKLAEIAREHLHKGDKVYVEGQIKTRKWDNKDGVTQYTTEVVLSGFSSELQMLGNPSSPKEHTPTVAPTPEIKVSEDVFDDDIPF